ncbi:MAG: hypothetical protein JSV96_18730 [Candidatus Aminicenantes bacterium]|nr:MAG: hypothetical protein JSV96_18730 [Candidatus Aminicenantes bacterium]
MRAKEIVVLILIIGAGIIFYHAQTGKLHIDWDIEDHIYFSLEEYISEESQEIQPPFPALIEIDNSHGDIEIHGTEEEKITVRFQKVIWRKNEEKAKEVSDKLRMIVNRDADKITLSTNRDEFKRKNFETNFRISLPQGTDIRLRNSYGLVQISKTGNTNIYNRYGKVITSRINGELSIQNSYRDVEVRDVQLDCKIDSKYSKVTVEDVRGETRIDHRNGKVRLENISQKVEVYGDYTEIFGQNLTGTSEFETSYRKITLYEIGPTKIKGSHSYVEVDGAKGNLEILNKYNKVNLNNIQGNLKVEGKSLAVYGKTIIGESIAVSSSYRDVELIEFSGKTTLILSHGKAVLEPSQLTHPIEVQGSYSDINLSWPLGGKYPFEAQAKGGKIKWDLPDELSSQQENGVTIIKAFLQETGNPSIFLSTSYGTIRVEQ